jgi:hypothetical protein
MWVSRYYRCGATESLNHSGAGMVCDECKGLLPEQ